ncbi:ORF1 [Polianthes potyvirus A]|nr:ORF1 [Polianthes potyvirus A]
MAAPASFVVGSFICPLLGEPVGAYPRCAQPIVTDKSLKSVPEQLTAPTNMGVVTEVEARIELKEPVATLRYKVVDELSYSMRPCKWIYGLQGPILLVTRKQLEQRQLQLNGDTPVTAIQAPEPAPVRVNDTPGIKCATSKKRTRRQQPPQLVVGKGKVELLMRQVSKVCRLRNIPIQVVGARRKCLTVRCKNYKNGPNFFARTRHHDHQYRRVDLRVNNKEIDLLTDMYLAEKSSRKHLDLDSIGRGASGLFFLTHEETQPGVFEYKPFIVRGRVGSFLVNSLDNIDKEFMPAIEYYSDPADAFWKGYDRGHLSSRPAVAQHECERNLSVEECGEIASKVLYSLFPMWKITCKQCINDVVKHTHQFGRSYLMHNIQIMSEQISVKHPTATHVTTVLNHLTAEGVEILTHLSTCGEVHKLIADQKAPPMQHLADLNDVLTRATFKDEEAANLAAKSILQLARWHLNRTENIKAGSVESFRNKISAKAHINPILMCDNQLDMNGNFMWRLRGYHAKRFFQPNFNKIETAEDYERYSVRKLPNSERKLAITKLIVPLDFEKFRESLVGEEVHNEPTSRKCLSLERGDYVYPCCCVTLNNGEPLTSKIMFPTKNHLVIGNTGDSKLVDLPTEPDDGLYIVKDGFCYVNIFLAMLVNVSDDNAKQFTKMTRDYFVSKLGKWPTMQDLATACYQLTLFFPEVANAELPRILVDHVNKTMHVVDSYGSLSTGYHILKANTVKQLVMFSHNSLDGEMKHYLVGGENVENSLMKRLYRGIYRKSEMVALIQEEPCILLLSLISPSVLIALYNSKSLEMGIHHWIHREMNTALTLSILESLGQKVSRSRSLLEQHEVITRDVAQINRVLRESSWKSESYPFVLRKLQYLEDRVASDERLSQAGFACIDVKMYETMEKIYISNLEASWRELSLRGKFSAMWQSTEPFYSSTTKLRQLAHLDERNRCNVSLGSYLESMNKCVKTSTLAMMDHFANGYQAIRRKVIKSTIFVFTSCIPDLIQLVNMLLVVSIMIQIFEFLRGIVREHKRLKWLEESEKRNVKFNKLVEIYDAFAKENKHPPTQEEFIELVKEQRPDLLDCAEDLVQIPVTHEAKPPTNAQFERIIAIVSLFLMVFDSARSDAVYRSLQKLKTLTGIANGPVHHQSIDDIKDDFTNENLVVSFELDSDKVLGGPMSERTFGTWWEEQSLQGRVVSHYRTGGHFLEFTRETAAAVSVKISYGIDVNEFLIRGAVGSGKSTGLPHYLSTSGHVLLIEPTRPLCENVAKQLKQTPFYQSPTLLMRGVSSFGSSPITVMTSGYALHYLANNPDKLSTYKFIMFDECHVMDANAMAFYCLLKELKFGGKILKVSATPPGRECEFETQKKVTLAVEENLTFDQFVKHQGDGSNCDVIKKGDNILVYVASYNDVDTLSKLLNEAGLQVTKVDGRTMKVGSVEIETKGVPGKPHFIVATNIIENGVTLNVDVVVDFGCKVEASLDIDCRCVRYNRVSISYGERIQRLGRVGRFKEGHALRIGPTMTGLSEIPTMIATEAAFYCFCYNLPVMTMNVTTSLLANCTVKQARAMLTFELSPYYTFEMVDSEGCMHPGIFEIFKPFRLRESDICLKKTAIPTGFQRRWITAGEYRRMGVKVDCDDHVGIPFYVRGIPERVHNQLWEAVNLYVQDSCLGRLTMDNATKIAYTLQTDVNALPRTIQIIDRLIEEETMKHTHYQNLNGEFCASGSISLSGILSTIKRRYTKDHSGENIKKLRAVRSQLLEFRNLNIDASVPELLQAFGSLKLVHHESVNDMSKAMDLKGRWNFELMTSDFIVSASVGVGAAMMLFSWFKTETTAKVHHQGFGKRQRQKMRFRRASDARMGYELDADQQTLETYFGSAYTQKGKKGGRKRDPATKNRRFVTFYGFDPAEYSLVRYVDALTGATYDDSPLSGVEHAQEHFGKYRMKLLGEDEIQSHTLAENTKVEAYFIKHGAKDMIKVDLSPHNPLLIGRKTNTIAKFPEREFELRQEKEIKVLPISELPKQNEVDLEVEHESLSLHKGLRDYNPIAKSICHLTNRSDGASTSVYGVGFGPLIITNRHLFQRNNGELIVKTHHGDFVARNTTNLQIHPVEDHELILIRMPKDFPPFASKLKFREPEKGERVCMVGTLFQEKSLSSTVSETCIVYPHDDSKFWSHHISTKAGYCGLPLVSVADGSIVGIHSISSNDFTVNYFTSFPIRFRENWLVTHENLLWSKQWMYNPREISWGALRLTESPPSGIFKTDKLVSDLEEVLVHEQGCANNYWVREALFGNLKSVAYCPNKLVTKHVVKGKCPLFDLYLRTNPEANSFFQPLMGAYGKSCLNKAAYLRDILKYATPIEIGQVQPTVFERSVTRFIQSLEGIGFSKCVYVTDEQEIFKSLNMNAAVGTLYSGKKKDFVKDFTDEDFSTAVRSSCLRLYLGQMGLWNGSLKAELRPMEKVLANKTRTFTAAPIETLLGGKVCVDDFNNQFYDLHIKGPWTVGMTKFYRGWDSLLNELPSGWLYCDADGSQFDSSLSPYLINSVIQIRQHFMEEWDIGETMLRNLYTEIVYTPIATPDGTVVKKFKGNNSGQPSTVVDNSLMVCVTMFYAMDKAGIDTREYKDVLRFFVNGDDLIIALRPDVSHILDTFQQSFSELGLNYNFDSRTHEKNELWFMSHQGVDKDGTYIPKLEMERVVSILEWDRSSEPEHRLEAICAAMIEAWGYEQLLYQIRLFYAWVLEMEPYKSLAAIGKAPYISEIALRKLYLDVKHSETELEVYLRYILEQYNTSQDTQIELDVHHQSGAPPPTDPPTEPNPENLDAGKDNKGKNPSTSYRGKDKDVNAGTVGSKRVPRITKMMSTMQIPNVDGVATLDPEHLLSYLPKQVNLHNTRATAQQYKTWYENVKNDYGVSDEEMRIIMNGFTVWCIENGTSPNINGVWTMMDGDEQVTFQLKPMVEHAKPTLRQIMAHHSDVAEAYIVMRNTIEPYMPRYGLQRNITDRGLAQYAFDFYEVTSRTPVRAREAHFQMKAAALRGKQSKLFGLDGNVGGTDENTERHTTDDVNRDMHTLLGVRNL